MPWNSKTYVAAGIFCDSPLHMPYERIFLRKGAMEVATDC